MNWKFCRLALSSPLHVKGRGGLLVFKIVYIPLSSPIRLGMAPLCSRVLCWIVTLLHIFMLPALWLVVTNDRTAHALLWGILGAAVAPGSQPDKYLFEYRQKGGVVIHFILRL